MTPEQALFLVRQAAPELDLRPYQIAPPHQKILGFEFKRDGGRKVFGITEELIADAVNLSALIRHIVGS